MSTKTYMKGTWMLSPTPNKFSVLGTFRFQVIEPPNQSEHYLGHSRHSLNTSLLDYRKERSRHEEAGNL